jgi:ribosomal protein L28
MANVCLKCGKKPGVGFKRQLLRGHYNPTNKKIKYPNLQWVKVPDSIAKKYNLPSGRRIKLCAKCIKSIGKNKE